MTELRSIEQFPQSFICTSGELLWGQIHCLAKGAKSLTSGSQTFDSRHDSQEEKSFRVKALPGKWEVSLGIEGLFIVAHESQEARQLEKRLLEAQFYLNYDCQASLRNRDLYNRLGQPFIALYKQKMEFIQGVDTSNWSCSLDFDVPGLDPFSGLHRSRCLLVDSSSYEGFLSALEKRSPHEEDSLWEIEEDQLLEIEGQKRGVHLFARGESDEEKAWLFFNEEDKLIGFIYDGVDALGKVFAHRDVKPLWLV